MPRFIHSLTFKIGAIIILVELVTLAILGLVYINRFSNELDRRIEAQAQLPGILMDAGLLSFDSVVDAATMKQLVGEELETGLVAGVNGNVFYSLNPDFLGTNVADLPGVDATLFSLDNLNKKIIHQTDSVVSISPIFGSDRQTPRFLLYIEVGTDEAMAQKASLTRFFVFGSVFTVLLTSVIIILSFNITILRRIRDLVGVLGQVEVGDLTARVDNATSPDEIGVLQRSANTMISARQQTENRIAHLNRVLRAIRNVNQLITQERDLDRLLEKACQHLTETDSYAAAWILLLNEDGTPTKFVRRDMEGETLSLPDLLEQNELMACTQTVLAQAGAQIITAGSELCQDCFLLAKRSGPYDSLAIRLEFEGKIYGLLNITVLSNYPIDAEEISLFEEVAGDISFALYSMELEEKRVQAESKLRENHARHAAMIANIGDVIAIVGADGMTKYQSPNIEKWFGWKPEDIFDKNAWDNVHPEDIEWIQKEFSKMLEKETASIVEFRFKCEDGKYKWIELTAVNRINDPAINGVLLNYHDISERKQAEKGLQRNELKYRNQAKFLDAVIENSPFAMQVMDVKGVIIRVNQALRNIMNLTDDMIIGKYNVLHDENIDTQELMPVVEAVFNDLKSARFIMFWTGTKAGDVDLSIANEHWIDVALFPITDEAGKLVNVVGQYIDITDRKQAEEKLKKNIASLQQAEVLAQLGNFERNWQTGEGYWSKGFYKLLGIEEQSEALTHKDFTQFIYPDDFERVTEHIQKTLREHESMNIKFRLVQAAGQIIHVHGTAENYYDQNDKPALTVGVFQDITNQIESQKELVESEKKLREAQEMAHLGFWSWDVKSGDVEWSEEVFKIFGLDPDTFTPQIDSILALSPWPEDHNRNTELINHAVESHTPGHYEQKFLHPDQSIGHYYSTFQGKYDENGELVLIVGTVLDITERKQAEAALQEYSERLEEMVDERTVELSERVAEVGQLNQGMLNMVEDLQHANHELEQTSGQLEAANKEMETFTYSVSHDLKAPLRGIDGYSRLLLEDYANILDDEGKVFLRTIRQAVMQMNQLIEDLLAYSRLERRDLQLQLTHPQELVERLLAERVNQVQESDITVSVNVPCETVSADPDGLIIALRNLIDNAIKFSGSAVNPTIEVGGQKSETSCIIWVRDNGVGFDMKYHDHIFDIFQRLHRAEEYPGTGIGLAMVRKAMERMQGKAWAESEPGQGATFYLEIPR